MIFLDRAPYTPYLDRRTAHPPGLGPMDPEAWTVVLPDYGAQIAYRRELLSTRRDIVLADGVPEISRELLDAILAHLSSRSDYEVGDGVVIRPDGETVVIDFSDPLGALGNLVAEDFCLLQPDAEVGEYRLVGAILCFPSRWLLSEKLGQPLTVIHDPVPDYDGTLARRVNRMFETLRPDRPLVRVNWLVHAVPELHLPMGHSDKLFQDANPHGPFYLRTERQTLVRLPETGAVAFGIKTSITPIEKLDAREASGLADALEGLNAAAMEYRAGGKVIGNAIAALHKIACAKGAESPSSAQP